MKDSIKNKRLSEEKMSNVVGGTSSNGPFQCICGQYLYDAYDASTGEVFLGCSCGNHYDLINGQLIQRID